MNNNQEESGLETTTNTEYAVRARAPKGKKGDTTRRLSMSGVMSTVRANYDVPTSSASVTALDGSDVYMQDPLGAAVTYLNRVEKVGSAVELGKRPYLDIEYDGRKVRFERK